MNTGARHVEFVFFKYFRSRLMQWTTLLLLGIYPLNSGLVHAEQDVEGLRAQLIAWSESLKSFDGRFILTQYPFGDPDALARGPKRMPVRYRFQGADRYMEIVDEDIVPDGGRAILSLALLDGKVSQRADDLVDGALEPLAGQINLRGWPLPEGAYLTPEEVFGRRQGRPLADWLAEGDTFLLSKDGRRVLSHRPTEGFGVDIWLDESDRVMRFDWVLRVAPQFSDAEIAAVWPGDPFDVRQVFVSIDLGSYVTLNGVEFPTFARKAWWKTVPRGPRPIIDKNNPKIEDLITWYTDVDRYEDGSQTFELQAEDAQVNVSLDASKFTLEYSEGMLMRDWATREDYYYSTPWYQRRPFVLALLALLVGAPAVILIRRGLSRGGHQPHHRHH